MIAKNESEVIKQAILSARPVASEFIIGIDDKTTDGTEEIVREMGITPFYFHWIGNFAWARNLTLARATSSHIFVMDPDERITQQGQQFINVILHQSQEADNTAFAFNFRHTKKNGESQVTLGSARLFPNRPDWRYQHSMHEEITADRVHYMPFEVMEHVGFDPSLTNYDVRNDRNERMIIGRILEDFSDGDAWRYLAYWYTFTGRDQDAAIAATEALRIDTGYDPEDYRKLSLIQSRGSADEAS